MEQKRITEPFKTKETDTLLREEIQKHEMSEFMRKFIPRMTFFEKEAQEMLKFLKDNPTATEEEIEKALICFVEELRKEMGMTRLQRECLYG